MWWLLVWSLLSLLVVHVENVFLPTSTDLDIHERVDKALNAPRFGIRCFADSVAFPSWLADDVSVCALFWSLAQTPIFVVVSVVHKTQLSVCTMR